MNVIFLDVDGVLNSFHFILNNSRDGLIINESKLPILKDICNNTNSQIVLSSYWKLYWGDKEEPQSELLQELLTLFKKYNIPFYGKTSNIKKQIHNGSSIPNWKEYEIKKYLQEHREIKHFCIIDDDLTDLESLRDYVVKTYDELTEEEYEGLNTLHKDRVKRILKKEI